MKNENRSGYKKTSVGWVPEDWAELLIDDAVIQKIIEKPLDGNHGNIHPVSDDFVDDGIPFVMASDVVDGEVKLHSCKKISEEQADSLQKGFSITGDVLLTHKASVGNTAIVGEIETKYIMLTPQVTYYRIADESKLKNIYLRFFFDSKGFQQRLSIL